MLFNVSVVFPTKCSPERILSYPNNILTCVCKIIFVLFFSLYIFSPAYIKDQVTVEVKDGSGNLKKKLYIYFLNAMTLTLVWRWFSW